VKIPRSSRRAARWGPTPRRYFTGLESVSVTRSARSAPRPKAAHSEPTSRLYHCHRKGMNRETQEGRGVSVSKKPADCYVIALPLVDALRMKKSAEISMISAGLYISTVIIAEKLPPRKRDRASVLAFCNGTRRKFVHSNRTCFVTRPCHGSSGESRALSTAVSLVNLRLSTGASPSLYVTCLITNGCKETAS
jgi:hypothetical protein